MKRLWSVAASTVAAIAIAAAGVSAAQIHVVQEGDTLWTIASRHGVSVEAIVSANGLSNPDALRLGQRLVIPNSSTRTPTPAAPSSSITYIVQPGDTLWSITAKYRVSVSAIVAANGLSTPDALKLGQRLLIPGVASPVTRAATPTPPPVSPVSHRTLPANAIPSRGAKWASALVNVAVRQLGVRYRWGGMSSRGFDCSGFINYVMHSVGVMVPRTTYAMYASGTPVPRDELRVGDIVFFQTVSPGPSHAGIYIGNNQFIHSSSGFGRVTVTSLDYRYYKPRFFGARRF